MSLSQDHAGPAGPDRIFRPSIFTRLAASRPFQRWAARFPLTRGIVRREGEAMFDIVAGFCHSQALRAFVGLGIPARLERPQSTAQLAALTTTPEDRLMVLMRSAKALGLVKSRRDRWTLTTRGAALASVPGLTEMIAHHDVLYRDLADPVAFFRGETEPDLARFWPYVFGAGAASDPDTAQHYSKLMADSQVLVAEDTLALTSFAGTRHLMDVGGGTGQFLRAVRAENPDLALTVFDLPAVLQGADLAPHQITAAPGSFRDDPLPEGADMISLVRVLYDHADETVLALLSKVRDALPQSGRLLVSEPMAGSRAGDAYFALYCLAMDTGRARSPEAINALLARAGFAPGRPRSRRPFITTVIETVKRS